MNIIMRTATIGSVAMFVFALSAPVKGEISSSIEDGGSVEVKSEYTTFANRGSSLRRTWVTVNDSNSPVKLAKAGINADYSDNFRFTPSGLANMRKDVVAFEVRFLLYDMFGNHMKTLSSTEVEDAESGNLFNLGSGEWRAWRNDATEFLLSVAYVAQVRTGDGKIWRYNAKGIARELAKVEIKIDAGLLEPTKEK